MIPICFVTYLLSLLLCAIANAAEADQSQSTLLSELVTPITPIHEPGYCAMYGVGGRKSFFGADLPQPNNIKAPVPTEEEHKLLLSICGESWEGISTQCCNLAQLETLKTSLQKSEPLISSCPACRENFYQLFCHFTCSPDQSTFVDVTSEGKSISGGDIVEELSFHVDDFFAIGFYDSCKNIKFGATNGYAMDLIGGGAKNYKQFLKFLGDEKPLLGGSPFQIDFVYNGFEDGFDPLNETVRYCNDEDERFRCACSDCPDSCPTLPQLKEQKSCKVGILPCFSFSVIIIYSVGIIIYAAFYLFVWYRSRDRFHFLHDDSSLRELFADDYLNDSDDQFTNFDDFKAIDSYIINNFLEKRFYKLGFFCSTRPALVISLSLVLCAVLGSFILLIQLETNPVKLWVSPRADASIQREIFDESFGPFYRTQQVYISNSTGDSVLQKYELLEWWFEKELEIQAIEVHDFEDQSSLITYEDLCFRPSGETCILESFTQYYYGEIENFPEATWQQSLRDCTTSPVNCLPTFQQPLKRELLFGGDPTSDILNSKAIVVTLLLNNDNDPDSKQVQNSMLWEHKLEDYLLNLTAEAAEKGLSISFSTEISLEKELNKSTNTDIRIVVISYLVMFAYASIALGGSTGSNIGGSTAITDANVYGRSNTGRGSTGATNLSYFITTRFGLGLIGILIVLLSVFSAAGFWSLMGVKSTLIIAEVIPFLVLAIGVDNIFLISNELSSFNGLNYNNENVHERVAKTISKIGPSILLSSACQFICYSLASMVAMPAVKNFALYSAFAIIFNTILQLTAFVSVISLDQRRIEDYRLDLLPFIQLDPASNSFSLPGSDDPINPDDSANEEGLSQMLDSSKENIFNRFIKSYYAPFLFNPTVSRTLTLIFVALFGVSLSLLPGIQIGLDQRIAIPSDSYLINYFNAVYEYLNVGPPMYLVVSDIDFALTENQQLLCGRFSTCEEFSLVNIMEQEYKRANDSTIAEPVSSWIDDFLLWLNPDLSECCRLKKTNESEFCSPYQPPRQCSVCYEDKLWNFKMEGFPQNETFMKFFNQWIESPSDPCPLGGKAPYSSSILVEDSVIQKTVFRTSHKPLRSQKDFIAAYHNSLRLVDEIKSYLDIEIFAYSPFYIFFVQYETIIQLTIKLIAAALCLIFVSSSILLGSLTNALILVLNVSFVLVNMGGVMSLWGISLNAISLVNLMICLGLAVEFSIHLIKAFNFNDSNTSLLERNNRFTRSYNALCSIGGSTLSGITMTKLIGIGVLSFTRSKIFQIYYFRMWFGLIVIASLHSIVLLPLLLKSFGGKSYQVSRYATSNSEEVIRRLRMAE
ncbi:hypothetical protein CANARDRAFT_202013 [[Candida] arabinofermentans NRRL YB-2248]|uniref:SSD domain-containing protein n=1 Tax=[Candida] arabinofermentans NRRL YB-2248 TaxID=983967 RepID=A0A1E4SXB1_9ASCO|nr:hypothetical protein CANARDRAFT_202013 [[Candida] arabinofermentans NRRL YB-2248]